MDWRKWTGKAVDYAADGAAEKTVDFALTKVGPYRVAGIIAKIFMLAAVAIAAAGWGLQAYVGYAGVFYAISAIVFGIGFLINAVRNFIFNKAKAALTTGAGWAASEVKKRLNENPNP